MAIILLLKTGIFASENFGQNGSRGTFMSRKTALDCLSLSSSLFNISFLLLAYFGFRSISE